MGEWREKLKNTLDNQNFNGQHPNKYSGYVYDAVWLYALALDRLIKQNKSYIQDIHRSVQSVFLLAFCSSFRKLMVPILCVLHFHTFVCQVSVRNNKRSKSFKACSHTRKIIICSKLQYYGLSGFNLHNSNYYMVVPHHIKIVKCIPCIAHEVDACFLKLK